MWRSHPIELPSNTQYDVESIRTTLGQLRVEQSTYEVKKGDTFNAIAYSLDMMPNELSVLNPDVIVNKLWVGQELIIQQAVPRLSVRVVTNETYEQEIPSPVEYIETAELYVGDTKVGEATQSKSLQCVYKFTEEGNYTVKAVARADGKVLEKTIPMVMSGNLSRLPTRRSPRWV